MPDATIVITTRNRPHDLMRAVHSCLEQTGAEIEVLIYDDASEDASVEMLYGRTPEVRVIRHDIRRGLIVRRNEGLRDARSNFVVFLDDDAYFTSPTTVAQTVELFSQFPEAAAIALPFVEPSAPPSHVMHRQCPAGTHLRSYVGCAHALRRDAVLSVGGYREFLVHQGEERDLSIRLLDAGWSIISGNTAPVVHKRSIIREQDRVDYFGYRNTLLFTALNAPLRFALLRLVLDSLQLLTHRPANSRPRLRLRNVALGWAACLRYLGKRRPVNSRTYRTYRRLPRHGPLPTERRKAERNGVTLSGTIKATQHNRRLEHSTVGAGQ